MIPTPEQVKAAIDKAEKADGAVASIVRTDFNRFSVWRGASDVRKRWVVGVLAFALGAYSAHVAHERGWFGLTSGGSRTAAGEKP